MESPIQHKWLENIDKDRAVMLWNMGSDTYDIARYLGVPESYIFNRLPSWRGLPADNERPQWSDEYQPERMQA